MKHLITVLAVSLLLARATAQTTDTTALHRELERKRFDAAEKQFMSCLKFVGKGSELHGGILDSLVILNIQ